MTQKEIEKGFFIMLLKEMRGSVSVIKMNQKNRLLINDELNISKLERFLDFLIEKESFELKTMKGEQNNDTKRT